MCQPRSLEDGGIPSELLLLVWQRNLTWQPAEGEWQNHLEVRELSALSELGFVEKK